MNDPFDFFIKISVNTTSASAARVTHAHACTQAWHTGSATGQGACVAGARGKAGLTTAGTAAAAASRCMKALQGEKKSETTITAARCSSMLHSHSITPAAKPSDEATTRGDAMLTQNTTQAPTDEAAPAPRTCGQRACGRLNVPAVRKEAAAAKAGRRYGRPTQSETHAPRRTMPQAAPTEPEATIVACPAACGGG